MDLMGKRGWGRGRNKKRKVLREVRKRDKIARVLRIQMAKGTDLRDNRSATTLPQLHSFATLPKLFLKRQTFTVHSHVFVRGWKFARTTVFYLSFLRCNSSSQFALAKSFV